MVRSIDGELAIADLGPEGGDRLMSARVLSLASDLGVEAPRVLFEGGFTHEDSELDLNLRFLDAAPDGRFLVVEPASASATASMGPAGCRSFGA